MSSLDEDDGLTDEGRAKQALIRACQRDRGAVTTLLAKYGAKKLPDLRLRDLTPFTRECEAIQAPPPAPLPLVEVRPMFAIGEWVLHLGLGGPMKVTGYQLRYVVDGGRCLRAETLKSAGARPAPPAPPPAPLPTPISDWDIGSALYNAATLVGAVKLGRSFATNADALKSELLARGLHIVRF